MKLLFAHGWGFDRDFWRPLAQHLSEWEHVRDDRGYFGAPHTPHVDAPCIAITHSFGTMRILENPPQGLAGIVAINGFERFTAPIGSRIGVASRVLDHMLRRFQTDPIGVLKEFRKSCGSVLSDDLCADTLDTHALHRDLLQMRDAAHAIPPLPVVLLHGSRDPILPELMRQQGFDSTHVHRITHQGGGHLLPIEAPDLCAAAVRGLIGALSQS